VIEIVSQPIDVAKLVSRPSTGEEGGIVSFVGTVRSSTRGRAVVRLEYEAYAPMAVSELAAIVATARDRFGLTELDVVHRVGVLLPGDVAVVIVARAPHRGAAFDGCRYAIDTLKQKVPIWKKEVFEDGEVWVGDRP
jgi:molybdopterin synthase catalytic subunit